MRCALTGLESAELLVRSFLGVARGHHRRNVTAGLAVARSSFHGRHGGSLVAVIGAPNWGFESGSEV
jgi:hypothetical protein